MLNPFTNKLEINPKRMTFSISDPTNCAWKMLISNSLEVVRSIKLESIADKITMAAKEIGLLFHNLTNYGSFILAITNSDINDDRICKPPADRIKVVATDTSDKRP